ncbi:MAG: hypothetical protein KatS3mg082_1194 [Nitrospiraceae bacterium]|nr:MAG: hypothetical protein KatS3mg082_1194 [Nitrospiraceae bacterium]
MGQFRTPFPARLFTDFSKRELQDFLEIFHYSVEAETNEDIVGVLRLLQKIVPCPHIIGGLVRVDQTGRVKEFANVLNISYPNDWLHRYAQNGYAQVDPVLNSLMTSLETQVWEHTYQNVTSTKQKEFIEDAKSFGLVNGVTTGSLEARRGLASFFSFAGGESGDNQRYAGILEYIIHHLHQALVKNAPNPAYNRVNGLSSRELAVLNWMKDGKTNWEIARILGVTERTVRFHIESIFIKLDVTSRTQAVALAVESGILTAT